MNNHPRTLGLIGGLGIEAGIYYYQHLAKAHERLGAPLKLVLVHAEARTAVGHMMAGERKELAEYLIGFVQQLASAGAEIAAIPAVTPHVCIDEVMRASTIPLVNILRAIAEDLQKRHLQRIALFGTKFVIESDLYGALPSSIDVVRPSVEEIERIDSIYRSYAVSGYGGEDERTELTSIANGLCNRRKVDAIVLAGTDLSALFEYDEPEFPYVDSSQVHIEAIMRHLYAGRT
jgi:aspartate racemase